MILLAIEFSSAQRSVALVERVGENAPVLRAQVLETGGRGTRACAMIEQALAEARLTRNQIEKIVVGLGPGSYNGIRASIAFAQGWQLSRGIPLLGVSSSRCLAAQAQAQGLIGKIATVIDAQRQEFYLSNFELSPENRREIVPLRIASRAEVESAAGTGYQLAGPEIIRWFPQGRDLYPTAEMLGKLASENFEPVPGNLLEPIYLRETQFVKAPVTGNSR